jgi:ribonuclease HI
MTSLFGEPALSGPKVEAVLHFDGACDPNPGHATGGFVLRLPAGKVVERSLDFGDGTCNTAEYMSLIAGLEAAIAAGVNWLEVYGDSKIVIGGVKKGPWKKGMPHLEALKAQAISLARKIPHVEFNWVAREDNQEADDLSKAGPR